MRFRRGKFRAEHELGSSPPLPRGEARSIYRTQTAPAYRKRLFIIIIIIKGHLLVLPRAASAPPQTEIST